MCLNVGCIPSKSLLKNAEVAHTLRERGKEALRSAANTVARYDPFLWLALRRTGLILAKTADTRAAIIAGLNANRNKQVFRPWRKHGVMPV